MDKRNSSQICLNMSPSCGGVGFAFLWDEFSCFYAIKKYECSGDFIRFWATILSSSLREFSNKNDLKFIIQLCAYLRLDKLAQSLTYLYLNNNYSGYNFCLKRDSNLGLSETLPT